MILTKPSFKISIVLSLSYIIIELIEYLLFPIITESLLINFAKFIALILWGIYLLREIEIKKNFFNVYIILSLASILTWGFRVCINELIDPERKEHLADIIHERSLEELEKKFKTKFGENANINLNVDKDSILNRYKVVGLSLTLLKYLILNIILTFIIIRINKIYLRYNRE